MSPLSYVFISISPDFGELISCFRVHMPPTFHILSTIQWWSPPIRRYHSGRVHMFWLIFMGWRGFKSVDMIRYCCKNCFEVICEIYHFIFRFLLVGFLILFVGLNCGLHDD